LLHGFSTGFKPTGTAAFIADIIPLQRRGEAMGLLGVAGSLGMAAGPAIGSLITNQFSLETMFYCSSGAALLSLAVQGTMTETLPMAQRERFSWRLLRLEWNEVLEPQVRAPAIVTLLCLFPFGIVLTVIPDQSQLLGIANKGLFFTFFTTASLVVRLVAGRASDTYGRVPILRVSAALLAFSMIMLMVASTVPVFLTAAVVFGLAAGLNSPTLYAWTIDLSHEQRRGRAVATMYIALEAGIGLGALLSGWLYGNVAGHLPYVHALGALATLAALGYLVWGVRAEKKVRVAA
jgi:MFS family permease